MRDILTVETIVEMVKSMSKGTCFKSIEVIGKPHPRVSCVLGQMAKDKITCNGYVLVSTCDLGEYLWKALYTCPQCGEQDRLENRTIPSLNERIIVCRTCGTQCSHDQAHDAARSILQ